MKEEILRHMNGARELERLYRRDKNAFKRSFGEVYTLHPENTLLGYWNERLHFTREEISWGSRTEVWLVIAACLLAGLIAKLPAILHLNEEFFYPRNIGFVIFPVLAAYFAWKNKLPAGKLVVVAGAILVSCVFINALPDMRQSDTLTLSCIHLLLFLWCVLGFAFVGGAENNVEKRISYLKYNGDLVVMTTLIVIAGGIMTGITIGLFSLIGWNIEEFYFQNIVVFALPAAPVVGTYLTQANPHLVGKVSPVIAKIFSPLVLIMLVIYLVAMVLSGKDPYNDREFLMIFNALLVGVMAIIFFSIAGTSAVRRSRAELIILALLSLVTIVVNEIALSAIVFRISEWGITPNRAAVLGGNVLILIHLIVVAVQLFRVLAGKGELNGVEKAISSYLPVYFVWVAVVTFLFPFLFAFR